MVKFIILLLLSVALNGTLACSSIGYLDVAVKSLKEMKNGSGPGLPPSMQTFLDGYQWTPEGLIARLFFPWPKAANNTRGYNLKVPFLYAELKELERKRKK
jgi:hypothetical protein